MVQTKARENQRNPFPKLFLLGLILLLVSLVLFTMANLPGKDLENKFNKCLVNGGVIGFFVNPNKTISRVCNSGRNKKIVQTLKISADDVKWGWVSVGYRIVENLNEFFDGNYYSAEDFANSVDFKWIFTQVVK